MNINRKHFAELFRVDYKTVSATFNEAYASTMRNTTKRYTYKLPKDCNVAIGDQLLVLVPNGSTEEYKCVTVVAVHENPEINSNASFEYKWAVGRIADFATRYEENVARDNRLKLAVAKLEHSLSRVELRKQIEFAMAELPADDVAELKALFGTDLLGPAAIAAA